MNTLETLKAVRKQILEPDTWTRTRLARDKNDHPVPVLSEAACKFCLLGAIARVSDIEPNEDYTQLKGLDVVNALVGSIEPLSETPHLAYIHCFNDTSTHSEVIERLDTIIAEVEAAQ